MKSIRLENFRCYKEQTIEFKAGINLLVGDNASGKTSILKACKYVLSSFFAGFSDENTKWSNKFSKDDFIRTYKDDGRIVPLKPIRIKFVDSGNVYMYERDSFNGDEQDITYITVEQELSQGIKSGNKIKQLGIKGYIQGCNQLSKTYYDDDKRVKPLPLFAYFAAKDYENTNAQAKKKFKEYYHLASFGYYECLDTKTNFNNWIDRLLVLEEGKENLQDVEIVRSAIVDALGNDGCNVITDMDVRYNQRNVYFTLSDGRKISTQHLSDGYKRVVNIVVDLAFRCTLLNRGMYGYKCCKETHGTVLIDEIDLHLHPTLQSTILKGLRNAFPNLQFIITSHAPMIMSSVESNEENIVYKLDYSNEEEYSVEEVVTYGMDLSTISEVVLEQSPRDPLANERLTNLYDLIDNEEHEEAKTLLNQYKAEGKISTPDSTEIEAILNCEIIDDTDEEDQ